MTSVYSLTAQSTIQRAYRVIGNLQPPTYTPTEDQLTQGMLALNILTKGLQADLPNLFRQTQRTLSIPAGQGWAQNPFQITPLVLGVEECRLQVQPSPNLYERPLAIYSYVDYMNLPNKQGATGSGPSIIALDRQVSVSNLYMYPLGTGTITLNGTFIRTANDINSPSDQLDFPIEWDEGLVYMLADRLMDDEGIANADQVTAQRIALHAATFYQKLLNFDRPASLYVRPWGRKGSGRFWR